MRTARSVFPYLRVVERVLEEPAYGGEISGKHVLRCVHPEPGDTPGMSVRWREGAVEGTGQWEKSVQEGGHDISDGGLFLSTIQSYRS